MWNARLVSAVNTQCWQFVVIGKCMYFSALNRDSTLAILKLKSEFYLYPISCKNRMTIMSEVPLTLGF